MLEVAVFHLFTLLQIAISLWAFKSKVYGRKLIFKFVPIDPNGPTEHSYLTIEWAPGICLEVTVFIYLRHYKNSNFPFGLLSLRFMDEN